MINTIVAAIVVLFSWAKVSKNTEEQTQLASWTKTIVLAILTIFVLVFYIKSYQVTTLYSFVTINDYKYCADSSGNIIDTITAIRITNQFSPGITENIEEKKIKKSSDERAFIESGSVFIAQDWHNDGFQKMYNSQNIKSQGLDTINGTLFNVPLQKCAHIYEVNVARTSVPSMIPLLPDLNKTDGVPDDQEELFGITIQGDFHTINNHGNGKTTRNVYNPDGSTDKVEGNNDIFDNAYIGVAFLEDTIKTDPTRTVFYEFDSNVGNSFNFFTAADISQYTQVINITSNCHVGKLIFMYDLPIEINSFDSCMVTSSHSFSLRGNYLNENIVKGDGSKFHVKLPTLANLQLIRSLILTTLLTALAALLFSNIFYLFRKYSLLYFESHKEQISEVRMKRFKSQMYILLSFFAALILYLTCRIGWEEPFHISMVFYSFLWQYYGWVIFVGVILTIALICFLFRNVMTKSKNKKTNKKG